MPGDRKLVDTRAAAAYLAVSPDTVRRLADKELIKVFRPGRSVRFDLADLDRYLDTVATEPRRR